MAWSAGAILTAAQLNTYVPQARTAWVPTITAASGEFTTTSALGRYIAMGKTIVWSLTVTITTAGTAAGDLIFTLPVEPLGAGYIGNGRETVATGSAVQVYHVGSTQGRVTKYDDTTIIASGRTLYLSGIYESA